MAINLPNDTQRLSIIGTTGSGKTQAAVWHLSHRDFHKMPWVIYNFKREETIDAIPFIRPITLSEIPIKPGVYVTHPQPADEYAVENQMWAIWQRGNMGVYIDEGYMVGRNNQAFRSILTQGRSKHIPIIILSQRPVWLDRFVFTESQFFQVFRINSTDDIKEVQKFVRANLEGTLPEYHSFYYDVNRNQITVLKPVPDIDVIYGTFERRLGPIRRVI